MGYQLCTVLGQCGTVCTCCTVLACMNFIHTHRTVAQFQKNPQESAWSIPTPPHKRWTCAMFSVSHSQQRAAWGRSAAAEFGQEIGHTEEDPHHQEVRAEGQQGQRVQEAGVQPEVTHWQQAAQVLLDHPLPRANAAVMGGGMKRRRRCGAAKNIGRKGEVVDERGGGKKREFEKKYKSNGKES